MGEKAKPEELEALSLDRRHQAIWKYKWVLWEIKNLAWWLTNGRHSINRGSYLLLLI